MGIYISGVKGLPEQVQENKEKIATIEEEIEGIDFDAIHNLENQVAENTEDINNMEGTIGTQNIAITQLGGRVDDLEDKTQEITRNSDNNITQVGEDLHVKGNITLDDSKSIILGNDGHNAIESSGNGNSYFDFDSQDNPEVVSDNNVYKFTDTGITLNGTPIGGSRLYQHNITAYVSGGAKIVFSVINGSSTPMTTRNAIASYLFNNSISSALNLISATGFTTTTYQVVIGVYATGSSNLVARFMNISTMAESEISLTTSYTYADKVIEL